MQYMILFQLYSFPKEMGKAAWLYGQTISLSSLGKWFIKAFWLQTDQISVCLSFSRIQRHTDHRRDMLFETVEDTPQPEPEFLGSQKPVAVYYNPSRKVLSEGWCIHTSAPVAFSPKCGLQGALQHHILLQKRKTRKGSQSGTSNRHVDTPNTSAWRGFQRDVTSFLLCLNALLTEILGMPFCIDTVTSSLKFLSLMH